MSYYCGYVEECVLARATAHPHMVEILNSIWTTHGMAAIIIVIAYLLYKNE